MLVQTYRRGAADFGAHVERTMLRAPRFAIAMMRSSRIAVDYEALAQNVGFRTRPRRRQLSVVLQGRAYFQTRCSAIELRAGDLVLSRQGAKQAEGYGGRACEALIIDWEVDELASDADAVGRIGGGDVATLRASMDRFAPESAASWVVELSRLLRALGLRPDLELGAPAPITPASKLYRLLGDVLGRLGEHPSLTELAASMSLSERHVNRLFGELAAQGHPFASWRDFLHEMRIDWATHLLSIPNVPLAYVANTAGYRSTSALCHAFSLRGIRPPGEVARGLAERWHG